MKIRTLNAAAVAATLVLSSAACSDANRPVGSSTNADTSASASAADGTPDPCQLLTATDLLAATGVTFEVVTLDQDEEDEDEAMGYRSCHYQRASTTEEIPVSAWVALYPTDRAEFDAGRDALLALPKGLAEIDGIGEAAYGNEESIRAFQPPYYVEVQVFLLPLEDATTITELTLLVLSRLT